MLPYWLLFLLPAIAAFMEPANLQFTRTPARIQRREAALAFTCVLITLMVGFRYEVGADWPNYFAYLYGVDGASFSEVIRMTDPGYQLANWISVEMGWGIYGVNMISAALFSLGLVAFCRSMPRPWLALAIAVPYLVIVVAMGYTRQGVALGLSMLGLVALGRKSIAGFVICVLIGATFHKTAVLLLPIAALASSKKRIWTIVWVAVVTVGAYVLLLQDSVESLYVNYVDAQYESQGAMVRLLMNSLPACALLLWWRKYQAVGVSSIWRWFAIISLALQGALAISPSSTAVDRVALYLLPLQLVVFGNWPDVFGRGRNVRGRVSLVLAYYGLVQFVWLVFGTYAAAWIPYRFYPLISL